MIIKTQFKVTTTISEEAAEAMEAIGILSRDIFDRHHAVDGDLSDVGRLAALLTGLCSILQDYFVEVADND
mgnify:CR=1 FL=1